MDGIIDRLGSGFAISICMLLFIASCSNDENEIVEKPAASIIRTVEVVHIEGDVVLNRQDLVQPVEIGAILGADDIITTGSSGLCEIALGTLLNGHVFINQLKLSMWMLFDTST